MLVNDLSQQRQLERASQLFLSSLSHELRTPLNSIIGFTGIILQELAGPLNGEQKKQLGMVRESAQHLLHLINDVLDISKIEAGQMELVNEPVAISPLIKKVTDSFLPDLEKKGLQVVVDIDPAVTKIKSDGRRVEQILINLLSNAIKFTEQGEVRLECELADSYLRTSISDTGIGIRSEDMAKLFQPFTQLESGLARPHEGTGLGLAICKRLVNMLGGEIWVSSGPWGSTFSFTLPVNEYGMENPA